MINIVSGVFPADSGTVELRGEQLTLGNPHDALRRGIAVVHQELTLFGHLTIWENIFAGHEVRGPAGRLRRQRMIRQSEELFKRLGIDLDPGARVQHLSLADQQMVEIAKGLSWDPTILILDEATSALDTTRVERVFETVGRLNEHGASLIFVSHRLREVFAIANQAVVLKDGQVVFLPHPVEFNLTIVLLRHFLAGLLGALRFRQEERAVADMRRRLRIRQTQWHQPVESLSGGNQQKVVLGKWMETGFELLLMDEPTRGIDVETKAEVYRLLRDLSEGGKAILVASTDTTELLGLCDRIYVLYEGRIQRELYGQDLTEYNLTHATMGAASAEAGNA
ncbi:MAG: hypothetical protein DLM70_10735 [Chloroflexi bacterium]|nr:MAG: hypothetical protein DLM70_10735 [Chloroflexota bacterium]